MQCSNLIGTNHLTPLSLTSCNTVGKDLERKIDYKQNSIDPYKKEELKNHVCFHYHSTLKRNLFYSKWKIYYGYFFSSEESFILQFVDEKVQWMHIDMAGPVWNDKKRSATGFGVSTLVEWVLKNSS